MFLPLNDDCEVFIAIIEMEARKREKSSSRHRSSPAPGMGSRPGQVNLPLQPMHKRNRESPAPNTASTSASNRRSGTIRSGIS